MTKFNAALHYSEKIIFIDKKLLQAVEKYMEEDELEKLHLKLEEKALAYYRGELHNPGPHKLQDEFCSSEKKLKKALTTYKEWAKNKNIKNKV